MLTRQRTRNLINLGKQTLASVPAAYIGEQVGKEIVKRAVNSTIEMVKKYTSKGRRGSGVPVNQGAVMTHRRRYKKKGRGMKRKKVAKSYIPNKKRTKFAKKVDKVLEGNVPIAIVSRTQYQQLRQTTLDRGGYQQVDKDGFFFQHGTASTTLHNASIAFGSKTPSNDVFNTTNNLDNDTKIHIVDEKASYFFKSTSNHVVNIEMYECRSKNNQDDDAQNDAGQSFQDQRSSIATKAGTAVTVPTIFGCSSSMFIELHKHWSVKVHRFKLLPGESATKVLTVCTNKVFELVKMQNNGSLWRFPKGSVNVFFRILNDPTVSGTSGDIHHWPSNTQGGVALRVHSRIRIRAPETASPSVRTPGVFIYDASPAVGEGLDQQVAYQNPITTATPL